MASKPERLEFCEVIDALTQRVTIASCTDKFGHKVKLTFTPSTNYLHTDIGGQMDGVFSVFGTQRAIDRYNELIGAN